MRQAWMTAALTRVKKMPSLKKLLTTQKPKRQTWQQQKAFAKALNAAFGGTVRSRDETR